MFKKKLCLETFYVKQKKYLTIFTVFYISLESSIKTFLKLFINNKQMFWGHSLIWFIVLTLDLCENDVKPITIHG